MEQPLQFHLPSRAPIESLSDAAHDMERTPGAYDLPGGFGESVRRSFRAVIAELSEAEFAAPFVAADPRQPFAPYWRRIFALLAERGMIAPPGVHFEQMFNDEPKIWALRALSPFPAGQSDGVRVIEQYCRGISLDLNVAISKVVGELLERYPLLIYRQKDLYRVSPAQLRRDGRRFLDPALAAGFAAWQKDVYPIRRYSDDSMFYWVEGHELAHGGEALIPAQFVFWNYGVDRELNEPHLREANTNGAAGNFTRTEAILSGIYELIQRDAFLARWLYRKQPRRIDPQGTSNPELRELLAQCERYKFDVVFLYTTIDLEVPSCVAFLLDKGKAASRVAMALGGGCGPDIEEAMVRALTEALGVHHWLRRRERFTLDEQHVPFRDNRIGQAERLLLWSDEKMLPLLERFLDGQLISLDEVRRSYPKLSSPEEELKHVLGVLRRKGSGYEVYVYDASHDLLSALGYYSVKVVIPALVPLYLGEVNACLDGPRFRELAEKMGWDDSAFPNPIPHPFP